MTDHEKVAEALHQHPEWGRNTIAKEVGITIDRAKRLMRKVRSGKLQPGSQPKPAVGNYLLQPAKEGLETEYTKDTGSLTSVSRNIKTLDDLLAYAKVDLKTWEVERYVVNKWEVGAKDDNKEIQVTPLYQIKAWLRRKVYGAKDALTGIWDEINRKSPRIKPVKYLSRSGNCLESSICDIHHGKLAWGQECGEDYDLKISSRLQEEAMQFQLDMSRPFKPEHILIVAGNDYFHTDNTVSTTTAGTHQDCDGRWQKQFKEGIASMVRSIEMARKVAPVTVLVVPGNHDLMTAFHLGEVLEAYFRLVPGVKIDNSPTVRKYWTWGKCLLGLTHGNNEKVASLPLIMAQEVPQLWAATRFREIHVGHFHKKQEIMFKSTDEQNGVRYRILPSLTPPDSWHTMHGYSAIRAAEAFVLSREAGFMANLSYSPTAEKVSVCNPKIRV